MQPKEILPNLAAAVVIFIDANWDCWVSFIFMDANWPKIGPWFLICRFQILSDTLCGCWKRDLRPTVLPQYFLFLLGTVF
jgi:hypothetical protein